MSALTKRVSVLEAAIMPAGRPIVVFAETAELLDQELERRQKAEPGVEFVGVCWLG